MEIEYGMDGDDLTFTRAGVERFAALCPVGELVNSAAVQKRLGVHRAQVSVLVYTGIQTIDSRALRLPVWVIGGQEFVARSELEAFAGHYKAAVDRREAREKAKRYSRPPRAAQGA